jgi:single-strand DNA-binding protein
MDQTPAKLERTKGVKVMSLNRATVIGNLGGDPELRHLPSGQPAVGFSIATDESFIDQEGHKQQRVEWHQIVAFGKLAETCSQYLRKGRQVYVEGRLRTREFEAKNNGGKRQRTEIVAGRVQFLGAPPAEETVGTGTEEPAPQADEAPF